MAPVTRSSRKRTSINLKLFLLWATLSVELRIEMLYYFTLRELYALSITPSYGDFARRELRSRLEALWLQWGLDVDRTLAMLGRTFSVMSGSAVLYICSPGNWWPGDLDFYCPLGGKDEVVQFFQQAGFQVVPTVDAETTSGNAHPYLHYGPALLNDVVTMRRPLTGASLNVIESSVPCAEAPIFVFHSTLVMNVLTSTGVVCYYPDLTLHGRGVANYAAGRNSWEETKDKDRALFEKYRRRGFDVQESCGRFHGRRQKECSICRHGFMHPMNDRVLRMPFASGEDVSPAGRAFAWQLGTPLLEKETTPRAFNVFRERGAVVLVQGDGDGNAYLYRGLLKMTRLVHASEAHLHV